MLELLRRYYQGELASLDEDGADGDSEGAEDGGKGGKGGSSKGKPRAASGSEDGEEDGEDGAAANGGGEGGNSKLLSERIAPRKGLPPLLVSLTDRKPERLHYLGGWWREEGTRVGAVGGVVPNGSCVQRRVRLHYEGGWGEVDWERALGWYGAAWGGFLTFILTGPLTAPHSAIPCSACRPYRRVVRPHAAAVQLLAQGGLRAAVPAAVGLRDHWCVMPPRATCHVPCGCLCA